MWEAQYLLVISERTGWTEDFIRWQLPLWRGLAYYHGARLLAGERCRWPGRKADTKQWAETLKRRIKEVLSGQCSSSAKASAYAKAPADKPADK